MQKRNIDGFLVSQNLYTLLDNMQVTKKLDPKSIHDKFFITAIDKLYTEIATLKQEVLDCKADAAEQVYQLKTQIGDLVDLNYKLVTTKHTL